MKYLLVILVISLSVFLLLSCANAGEHTKYVLNGRYLPVNPGKHPLCMDSFSFYGLYFQENQLHLASSDFLFEMFPFEIATAYCVNYKLEEGKMVIEKTFEKNIGLWELYLDVESTVFFTMQKRMKGPLIIMIARKKSS